jgi:hypothetical protein
MTSKPKRRQRGQAMSEFVAAMALMLPLVLGVIYVGKYADIKHQAIQASRYAAMERALDPHGHEADVDIQNETVARFFRDNGKFGTIKFQDKAGGATASDENPLWSQVNTKPMLGNFADVTVSLGAPANPKSLNGLATPLVTAASKTLFTGLPSGGAVEADVEVPVVNIAHFKPLKNINLKIGATTVIAGDPWNAGGAQSVADHYPKRPIAAVPARAGGFLSKLPGANLIFQWLADAPPPTIGCLKPDVVPASVATGANYQASDPCL